MVAEMTKAGAAGYLDCLGSKYAGRPVRFFGDAILGDAILAAFTETQTPVLCDLAGAEVIA